MFQILKETRYNILSYIDVILSTDLIYVLFGITVILTSIKIVGKKRRARTGFCIFAIIITIFGSLNYLIFSNLDINVSLPKSYSHNNCHNRLEVDEAKCAFGDLEGDKPNAILVGDSHAAQYLWSLEEIAVENKFKLVSLTHSACPYHSLQLLMKLKKDCTTWSKSLEKYLLKQENSVIIFSGATNIGYKSFEAYNPRSLAYDFMRKLKKLSTSNKILIISDSPFPAHDSAKCLRLARLIGNLPICDFNHKSTQLTTELGNIDKPRNIQIADPTNAFCASICFASIQGKNIYRDESHLSINANIFIRQELEKSVLDLMNELEYSD
jgi:hypothetical protein